MFRYGDITDITSTKHNKLVIIIHHGITLYALLSSVFGIQVQSMRFQTSLILFWTRDLVGGRVLVVTMVPIHKRRETTIY